MKNFQNIEFFLEIDDSLNPIIDSDNLINREICIKISEGINKILELLGIPGKSKVYITNLKKEKILPNRFMRIILNGYQCRYPDALPILVQNYIRNNRSDISFELGRDLKSVLIWLRNILNEQTKQNNENHINIIDFFSLSCLEIVKLQPEILLDSDQFNSYLSLIPPTKENENLNSESWASNHGRMHQILRKVINQRISIKDKQKIVDIICEGWLKKRLDEDIIEDLLVALRTDVIEIEISEDYLKKITITQQNNDEARDMFKLARDGLFYELGIHYPDFLFVINENLNPYNFKFKINHLATFPQVGLKPDEFLVNDTTERLKLLNINSKPSINPVNLSEHCIIHSKDVETVKKAGLSTWDFMQYLILSFTAILRKYSSYFIHFDQVDNDLDEYSYSLSSFASVFPELTNAVKSVVSVKTITRLLRKLVSEEVSILNLRDILESILEFFQKPYYNQSNYIRESIYDYLTDFIRTSLSRQINYKFSSLNKTLVVYILDPDIETYLLINKDLLPLDHPIYKKLLILIRHELNENVINGKNPIILTKVEIRSFLRKIIAPECPRISVLAYSEISADLNIQPMSMIKLIT